MKRHLVETRKTTPKATVGQKMQSIMSSNVKSVRIKAKGKRRSSIEWLQRQLNDPFVHAAKKDGVLSRAYYKLMEMDEKFKLFKKNQLILDLGAAPGSWMQYIAKKTINKNCHLIGVDLLEIVFMQQNPNNTYAIIGDLTSQEVQAEIESIMEDCRQNNSNKANVILSDIAPNTIGIKSADHLAIMNIIEDVVTFAIKNLTFGGSLVMKIFQGSQQTTLLNTLKQNFSKVTIFKPTASRSGAKEIYLIAQGHKNNKPEKR